jgi:hypothetical protein
MATAFKNEAHRLIDGLPDDATWEALMRAIYERMRVAEGWEAARAGRVRDVSDIRREFGLPT